MMSCLWCDWATGDAATCPVCGHDPRAIAGCDCSRCSRGPVIVFEAPPVPPPPSPPVQRTVKGNAAEWLRRLRGLVPLRRNPGPS